MTSSYRDKEEEGEQEGEEEKEQESDTVITHYNVPSEVWVEILTYLPFTDCLTCRTVSKDLKEFTNDALEKGGMRALTASLSPFKSRCRHITGSRSVRLSQGWTEAFLSRGGLFECVKEFFTTLGPGVDPPQLFQIEDESFASYLRNQTVNASIREEVGVGGQRKYCYSVYNTTYLNLRQAILCVRDMVRKDVPFMRTSTKEAILGVLLSAAEMHVGNFKCRHELNEDMTSHNAKERKEEAILFMTSKGVRMELCCNFEQRETWD